MAKSVINVAANGRSEAQDVEALKMFGVETTGFVRVLTEAGGQLGKLNKGVPGVFISPSAKVIFVTDGEAAEVTLTTDLPEEE